MWKLQQLLANDEFWAPTLTVHSRVTNGSFFAGIVRILGVEKG